MREPAALRPDILDSAITPSAAAELWGGAPESVEHVSTGASFTYRSRSGERRLYLRLTPPGWQDRPSLRGETTLIEALHAAGISVSRPVASRAGAFIEPVMDRGNEFLAMAFEEAPGRHVPVREWDETRTRRFGRLMAEAHAAAPHSLPPGQERPSFEHDLALNRKWLPASETVGHAFLDHADRLSRSLPRTADVFGLVHYDLCEDNMLWSDGEPTLIDFDDCMFTWFAADTARALGSLLNADLSRYHEMVKWWLDGY